jgi:hypothetical protein
MDRLSTGWWGLRLLISGKRLSYKVDVSDIEVGCFPRKGLWIFNLVPKVNRKQAFLLRIKGDSFEHIVESKISISSISYGGIEPLSFQVGTM